MPISYRYQRGDRIVYTREQTIHYNSRLRRWTEGQRLGPIAIIPDGDNRILRFATRREATGAWTVYCTKLQEPVEGDPGTPEQTMQIVGYGNPPPGWDPNRQPRYYVRSLARDRCWFANKGSWLAHPPAGAVLNGRVAGDNQTYGFLTPFGAEVTERFAHFAQIIPGADPPPFPVVGVRVNTATSSSCVAPSSLPSLTRLESRLITIDGTPPTPPDNGRRWECVCNCPDKTRSEAPYPSPYPSTGFNRDWTTSDAGTDWHCKHEVAAYRALGNPLARPGVIDIRFEFERPPRRREDFPDYTFRDAMDFRARANRRRRRERRSRWIEAQRENRDFRDVYS